MKRGLVLILVAVLAVAVAPGLGLGADTEARADLAITQPHYVDDPVRTDTGGNQTTYLTSGRVLHLAPENFDAADVTDYGIRERTGELTYDDDLDAFTLNTNGENGTLHLYWVTEETREVTVTENNTTTTRNVTETVRYEAAIQTSDTRLEHVQPGLIERYQSDAQNWSEWKATICEVTGGNPCNIQQETQQAVNQMKIIHNPAALFTGGLTTALIILFTSPGGLLLVLADKAREHFSTRSQRSKLNKIESLDSDRATVEDELDILDREKRERNAATQDIGEIIDDPHLASAVRQVYGDTVHDVHVGYNADTKDENVAHDRLQAMALAGYSATLERRDGDDEDAKVYVHEPVEDQHSKQPGVRLSEIDHEHLRGLLPWLAVDATFCEFDLPNADIDREKLEMRTSLPASVDELADEYRDREFEFHDAEAYAKCLADLFADIEQKPLTDGEGRTNTVRDRLSSLFRFESVLEDECPLPVTSFQKHRHRTMLEMHDPAESARNRLRKSKRGENV